MSSPETIAARLRALAQDHFEGRLSHASYRRLRGPLLDSLVPHLPPLQQAAPKARSSDEDGVVTQPRANLRTTGSFRVGDTQPRDAARAASPGHTPPAFVAAEAAAAAATPAASVSTSPPLTDTRPKPGAATGNGATTASSPRKPAGLLISVAVVVVVAGAATFWYLRSSPSSGQPAANSANAALESNAAYRLVTTFAQESDWSDSRLVALNTDLRTVGEDVLAAASESPVYHRFVDDVRRRFKEQQALAQSPLVPENSPIAALAVTVGLDLHSPDSAVRIAPPVARETPRESPQPAVAATSTTTRQPAAAPAHVDSPPVVKASASASAPTPAPALTSVNSASTAHRPAASTPPPASASASTEVSHVEASTAAPGTEPCSAALAATRRPRCQDALKTGGVGPLLSVVPAGAYDMGNAAEAVERPVHHVSIATPFAMSAYEVSQAEYRTFCEHTGRSMPAQPWSGDDYPVVKVSWNDAQEYVGWLSTATGQHYRLPTEAEWEYAARAGVTGLFPSGDTLSPSDAWFSTVKQRIEMPARRAQQFNRNKFQLFHMVGNVREWVQDSWVPQYDGAPTDGSARKTDSDARVVRGGAYVDSAAKLRLTTRESLGASASDVLTGIRVVRDVR